MKSELAKKRDKWLESEEGKKCCSLYGIGNPPNERYLKNRIELAFLAGAQASEEIQEELCQKLVNE